MDSKALCTTLRTISTSKYINPTPILVGVVYKRMHIYRKVGTAAPKSLAPPSFSFISCFSFKFDTLKINDKIPLAGIKPGEVPGNYPPRDPQNNSAIRGPGNLKYFTKIPTALALRVTTLKAYCALAPHLPVYMHAFIILRPY